MTRSLFSDRWYRVIDLHPRMPAVVKVDRQMVRGELWYVLSSGARTRSFRVNTAAWGFIGRCSAERSVQQVWDLMLADSPEDAPTQDEIIQLLTRLYSAGLIEFERPPDIELMLNETRRQRKQEQGSRLNPLSFRVPLGDPTAIVDRIERLAPLLFSLPGLAAWALLLLAGMCLVLSDPDAALRHASMWMQTPRYILIGWCCYPFIKAIHEAAHALALRRWDGHASEAGVTLFCLLPMPYVDASDANRFAHRYQRAAVSAAGIMAELAVASLGLMLWSMTEPGLVNDIAFSLAFIGGVSTVIFNANPLMRLDGYHLLCDLMSLPNLAARSANWWKWCFTRYLLRVAGAEPPSVADGELHWLVLYAPAAWVYRVMVAIWLTLWGGSYHPLMGVIVGIMACAGMVGMPIVNAVRQLSGQLPRGGGRLRGQLRLGSLVAGGLALLTLAPLPDRMIAQGVVWLPEQAQVRPAVDGFVVDLAEQGAQATPGSKLVQLDDPSLRTEYDKLVSRREGLVTGMYQALATDLFKGRQVSEDIASVDEQLTRINERQRDLVVVARSGGQFTVARPQDLPGRYFKQGETIGYLFGEQAPLVRAVVRQEDVARLRAGVSQVHVQLVEDAGRSHPATIARFTPSASDRLPSAALGDRAGGDMLVDPADKDGTRTVAPAYVLDLAVQDLPGDRTGGRVWVRFDFGYASAAAQTLRYIRQVVTMRFSPFET